MANKFHLLSQLQLIGVLCQKIARLCQAWVKQCFWTIKYLTSLPSCSKLFSSFLPFPHLSVKMVNQPQVPATSKHMTNLHTWSGLYRIVHLLPGTTPAFIPKDTYGTVRSEYPYMTINSRDLIKSRKIITTSTDLCAKPWDRHSNIYYFI